MTSPQRQLDPGTRRFIFRLVAIIIIIVLTIPVIGYFAITHIVHSTIEAHQKATIALQTNKDGLISQFNQMNIVPGDDTVTAEDVYIDTSGGESNLLGIPTLKAIKHYAPNQAAGTVYDNFQAVLKKDGFELTSDTEPPCVNGINGTYGDTYYYQKDTMLIYLYLTCMSTTSDQSSWKDIPITSLDESLSISAY